MANEIKEKLTNIETKIDNLDSRLDKIDTTLVKHKGSLDHHIYRTNIAEKRLEHIEEEIVPIKSHIDYVKGGIKLLSLLALILGILRYLGKI